MTLCTLIANTLIGGYMNLSQMLDSLPNKGQINLFKTAQDEVLCEYLDNEIIITHYYDFHNDDWSFLSAFSI